MAAVRNVYHRRGALGEDFRGRGAERRANRAFVSHKSVLEFGSA